MLIILRHFISKDEYTENHCYRVSVVKGTNKEFDPEVVRAFVAVFDHRDLEVPNVII